jgi:hypothetical protein
MESFSNQTMTFPNFTFCIPMAMINSIYNSAKFKTKADVGGKVSSAEAIKVITPSDLRKQCF